MSTTCGGRGGRVANAQRRQAQQRGSGGSSQAAPAGAVLARPHTHLVLRLAHRRVDVLGACSQGRIARRRKASVVCGDGVGGSGGGRAAGQQCASHRCAPAFAASPPSGLGGSQAAQAEGPSASRGPAPLHRCKRPAIGGSQPLRVTQRKSSPRLTGAHGHGAARPTGGRLGRKGQTAGSGGQHGVN